jgi:hypothetical protein
MGADEEAEDRARRERMSENARLADALEGIQEIGGRFAPELIAEVVATLRAVAQQPQSSVEMHQQRGRHFDIIQEAISTYDEWMLDDCYDATTKLNQIIEQMRKRLEFSAAPEPSAVAQQPVAEKQKRTSPLTRHLRLIARDVEDSHWKKSILLAVDILENRDTVAQQPAPWECQADRYALWCDKCNCHPAECPKGVKSVSPDPATVEMCAKIAETQCDHELSVIDRAQEDSHLSSNGRIAVAAEASARASVSTLIAKAIRALAQEPK